MRSYLCYFCDELMPAGTGQAYWLPAEKGHTVRMIKAAHSAQCIQPERYSQSWRLLTDSTDPEAIKLAVEQLKTVYRWRIGFSAAEWLSNKWGTAWTEAKEPTQNHKENSTGCIRWWMKLGYPTRSAPLCS